MYSLAEAFTSCLPCQKLFLQVFPLVWCCSVSVSLYRENVHVCICRLNYILFSVLSSRVFLLLLLWLMLELLVTVLCSVWWKIPHLTIKHYSSAMWFIDMLCLSDYSTYRELFYVPSFLFNKACHSVWTKKHLNYLPVAQMKHEPWGWKPSDTQQVAWLEVTDSKTAKYYSFFDDLTWPYLGLVFKCCLIWMPSFSKYNALKICTCKNCLNSSVAGTQECKADHVASISLFTVNLLEDGCNFLFI